jgi:hypothetical protein
MKKYILSGIKYLLDLGFLGRSIRISYQGKGVSLNKFYKQGHWTTRSTLKNQYFEIFDKLFVENKDLTWLNSFYLVIFYNSRHDVDNVTGMSKVFVDALKKGIDRKTGEVVRAGYVEEDNKQYFKGLAIFPDPTLPYNTFDFVILEPKW